MHHEYTNRTSLGKLPLKFLSTISTEIGLVVFSLLTGILSARWLGPEGRGEFAIITLWPSILAAIGNLGVQNALVYYQSKEFYPRGQLNAIALILTILQSIILITLGLLFIPYLTRSQVVETRHLSLCFLIFIPLNLLSVYMLSLLRGRLNINFFNAVRLSVNAIYLMLMVFLLALKMFTLHNLTFALLGANLFTACWAVSQASRDGKLEWKLDTKLVQDILSYGIRNHLGSISNMFNQRLDQMLMSVMLSPTELGWYVVAVSSSGFVTLVSRSLSVLIFPRIAGTHDQDERRSLVRFYSRVNITGTILLSVMLMAILPIAIPLIYKSSFKPSIIPSEVLVIATMFLAIGQNFAASFLGSGQPLILAKAEGISLLATIIGLMLFLPGLGILGAALASLFAYGIYMLYLILSVEKSWELKWTEILCPMSFKQLAKIIHSSSGT